MVEGVVQGSGSQGRRLHDRAASVAGSTKSGLISSWRIIRGSPLSMFGFGLVILYLAVSVAVIVAGRFILPYGPNQLNAGIPLSPPSFSHPFGTDNLGRDIFTRVLAATPLDLGIGIGVASLAMAIGGFIGLIAGFQGGMVDSVLMRITDIFLSIPSLILALAISVALGPSVVHSIEAISFVWWASYARLARGQALSTKNQLYVVAARASGTKEYVILGRHVFRNIFDTLFIYMTMDIGTVILTFSTLSFLGVGIQPPTAEWGSMVINGNYYITTQPWIPLIPGFAIFFAVFAFSLIGDVLRDVLDPKTRKSMI